MLHASALSHEPTNHVEAPFIFQCGSRLNELPHRILKLPNIFHLPICCHKPATTDNKTMEATKEFEQLPMHDSSVIEEAKALIEKLSKMTQASSAHAVHELPHIEPIVSEAHDDDASVFSGYSIVTPSAASKSERDDEKIPLDQQVYAEEQIDSYGGSHAPEFDISGLAIESDIGNSHPKVKGSTTIKQPQEDDTSVFQTESESTNGKRKLVGIVITFEQGVDFDEGQSAVRFVGDHLGVSVGPQAKEIRVLSIEGNGHLEVSTPPRPERDLDSSCLGHDAVELVAKIHRVEGNCREEGNVQGNAPTVSSHESTFFPPCLEPVVTAATPSLRAILTLQRTELAKARTLRALIGPNHAACFGNCLNVDIQEAGKGATENENDRPPTLSELVDIAKTKLHRKLTTTREHLDAPEISKQISTTKKKAAKAKKAKLTKSKCTSTLACEKTLVITASGLLFVVFFLVFCLAGMSTARRGHFVGLWLGS
jgi:hypothetical protein